MSVLVNIRTAMRTALVTAGLWTEEEIIIDRRLKIWNEVAQAISATKHGAVLVIGIAKGDTTNRGRPRSGVVPLKLTVPVTLIELPKPAPDATEEDLLWEQTVMALEGAALDAADRLQRDCKLVGFDEIEHSRYVMRQTIFEVRAVLESA